MTVDDARQSYRNWTSAFGTVRRCAALEYCGICGWTVQQIDAASIRLDLAVSAARAPYSAPSWLGGAS